MTENLVRLDRAGFSKKNYVGPKEQKGCKVIEKEALNLSLLLYNESSVQ